MKVLSRSLKCFLLAIMLVLIGQHSQAQFFKKLKNKVSQTASDHVVDDAGNAPTRQLTKEKMHQRKEEIPHPLTILPVLLHRHTEIAHHHNPKRDFNLSVHFTG